MAAISLPAVFAISSFYLVPLFLQSFTKKTVLYVVWIILSGIQRLMEVFLPGRIWGSSACPSMDIQSSGFHCPCPSTWNFAPEGSHLWMRSSIRNYPSASAELIVKSNNVRISADLLPIHLILSLSWIFCYNYGDFYGVVCHTLLYFLLVFCTVKIHLTIMFRAHCLPLVLGEPNAKKKT